MARRRLDSLPCGGGSPLAHAVSLAARTGLAAQQGGDVGRVMTVLITDGRANVPLAKSNDDPALQEEGYVKLGAEELKDEVRDMARKLAASGWVIFIFFFRFVFACCRGRLASLVMVSGAVLLPTSAVARPLVGSLKQQPPAQHAHNDRPAAP